MESLPDCKIFQYNPDTMYEVRKLFDLHQPGAMKRAVDILEEWVKAQKHFTKTDFDRVFLEKTIIMSKGSVERAKARMDRACTIRTLMPHLFGTYDLRTYLDSPSMRELKIAMLPKMTKNHERVYVLRNHGKSFEPTLMLWFTRIMVAVAEIAKRYDYASNYLVVLDYMEANLAELAAKLTINEMQELVTYCMEGCGFRIAGIFILSNSRFIDLVVKIFKQVLKTKIGDRISVFKDRHDLLEVIQKDILPQEYGGNDKSLEEMQEDWLDFLMSEDQVKYLRDINSGKTDESKRQKDKFNEEYMGMPGTFRVLSVD